MSFAEVHIVIGSIATLPWESVNSQLAPVFAGPYEAVFDCSAAISLSAKPIPVLRESAPSYAMLDRVFDCSAAILLSAKS